MGGQQCTQPRQMGEAWPPSGDRVIMKGTGPAVTVLSARWHHWVPRAHQEGLWLLLPAAPQFAARLQSSELSQSHYQSGCQQGGFEPLQGGPSMLVSIQQALQCPGKARGWPWVGSAKSRSGIVCGCGHIRWHAGPSSPCSQETPGTGRGLPRASLEPSHHWAS